MLKDSRFDLNFERVVDVPAQRLWEGWGIALDQLLAEIKRER